MSMDALKKLEKMSESLKALSRELDGVRGELLDGRGASPDDGTHSAPSLGAVASFLQLSLGTDEDELINMVLHCAMHVTEAGGAGLTLFDHHKKKLVFRAAIGDGAEGVMGLEVPLEGSVHGLAFASGEVQSMTPMDRTADERAGVSFHSVLAAPLIVGQEAVGTMSAVNKRSGGHFTPGDMDAYRLFADLAAQVIRQRLREEALMKLIRGERAPDPGSPEAPVCSESDLLLLKIAENIGELSTGRDDLLPLLHRMTGLMVEMTARSRWKW